MRSTIKIILCALLITPGSSCQDKEKDNLASFNAYLGDEKAAILNKTLENFEDFLNKNYRESGGLNEQIQDYLTFFSDSNKMKSDWTYDPNKISELLTQWESSGLRKEIWIKENEISNSDEDLSDYLPTKPSDNVDSLPGDMVHLELDLYLIEDEYIPGMYGDSMANTNTFDMDRISISANVQGRYWIGLAKYALTHTQIKKYLELAASENLISRGVVAGGFLNAYDTFDDPFVQRMVITEFYYFTMKEMVE